MPRRPLPPEARRVRVDLTLAPATVEALDALAVARATTRSALVEQLVREAAVTSAIKNTVRRRAREAKG